MSLSTAERSWLSQPASDPIGFNGDSCYRLANAARRYLGSKPRFLTCAPNEVLCARKNGLRWLRHLRWYGCWTTAFQACECVRDLRSLTSVTTSPRTDAKASCALAPGWSPLASGSGIRLSETYGFLPLVAALRECFLQKATQGTYICARNAVPLAFYRILSFLNGPLCIYNGNVFEIPNFWHMQTELHFCQKLR